LNCIAEPLFIAIATITPWTPHQPLFSWCSECDETYVVEQTVAMEPGNWSPVAAMSGNGTFLTYRIPGDLPEAYFRIYSSREPALTVKVEQQLPTINSRIYTGSLICGRNLSAITQEAGGVGHDYQRGTFSGGKAAGLGVERGVILGTGDVRDAVGPNGNYVDLPDSFDDASTEFFLPGDPDLDLISTGRTEDAASVEFGFNCIAGTLSFKYAFASEEYDEFVFQGFNDIFAVFLDGQWIDIESTFLQCPWVKNTSANVNGLQFGHEYDGFITANDTNNQVSVPITQGHHVLKFVIADVLDGKVDSAVFIGGVSVEP
jgi:hypothetical protein